MSHHLLAFPDSGPAADPAVVASPAKRTRLRLHDSQVVALARSVCAADPALRAGVLAGGWGAAALGRLATAAVTEGITAGELRAGRRPAVEAAFALRLATLLATARPVAGGCNSLAEFLGGRAGDRVDRLVAVAGGNR